MTGSTFEMKVPALGVVTRPMESRGTLMLRSQTVCRSERDLQGAAR